MAYKFQLGAARLSGSTTFEQPLVVEDSFNANSLSSSGDLSVGGAVRIDGATAVTVTNTDQLYFRDSDGTVKMDEAQDVRDLFFSAVSGDATIAAGGALTIGAGAVEHGMLADDIISGQAELAHADINDDDEMMIDDAGVVKKVGVDSLRDHFFGAVSGDATVADGGALTIAADAVESGMLNDNVISGQTDLGGASAAQADELLFSDGGTLKKITFSDLEDSIFGNVSGQATVAAGGALSLAAAAVTGQTEKTGDVADADELMISDAGGLKRLDFSVLRDAVYNDISGDATIAAGGALTISGEAVEDGMLNDNVATGLAGDGLSAASGVMAVDVSGSGGLEIKSNKLAIQLSSSGGLSMGNGLALDVGQLAEGSPTLSSDFFIFTAPGEAPKRESFADLAIAMAGDGIGPNAGTFLLDLNELTAAVVDVAADSIAIVDAGDSNATRKESIADLVSAIAGDGLSADAGVMEVEVAELDAVTSIASGDTFAIAQESETGDPTKKITFDNMAAKLAGAGLSVSSGVLSVTSNNVNPRADGESLTEGYNIFADLSSDATVTMPSSAGSSVGDVVVVKAKNLTSAKIVIASQASAQKIDGQDRIEIESPFGAVTMVYVANDDWRIV